MAIRTDCLIWNLSDEIPFAKTSDCDCITSPLFSMKDMNDTLRFHLYPSHKPLEKRVIVILERDKVDYNMIMNGQISINTEDGKGTKVLARVNIRSLFHTGQREEIYVMHKDYQPFRKYHSPIFLKFDCEIIDGIIPRRCPERNKIILSDCRRQVLKEVSNLDRFVLQQFCFCPCHAIFRTRFGRCNKDPIWLDKFETAVGVKEVNSHDQVSDASTCCTAKVYKKQFVSPSKTRFKQCNKDPIWLDKFETAVGVKEINSHDQVSGTSTSCTAKVYKKQFVSPSKTRFKQCNKDPICVDKFETAVGVIEVKSQAPEASTSRTVVAEKQFVSPSKSCLRQYNKDPIWVNKFETAVGVKQVESNAEVSEMSASCAEEVSPKKQFVSPSKNKSHKAISPKVIAGFKHRVNEMLGKDVFY